MVDARGWSLRNFFHRGYDAMTSERSYRKPLSKKESIHELMKCSGTQFDPEIVNIFVNQVLQFQEPFPHH
jgi:HD-GYP domain-containing protein (c-di-GMP phosphodiesterase class II)